MPTSRSARAVAGLVLLGALAGCGTSTARRPPASAPAPAPAVLATAGAGGLDVSAAPGGPRAEHLSGRTRYGSPRVLLVLAGHDGWLRVLLPQRPNGSTGWVRASDVRLTRTSYRVVVSLSRHLLQAYDGNRLLLSGPVSTGTSATPTPTGTFDVTDVVRVPSSQPWYGPFALGLSGFSPTLTTFAGGDAQVALHGTDQPGQLGRSVSHGCVRLPNTLVARLAALLPLGTPVTIAA